MLGFLLFVISFSGFTLAQNIFMPLQRESVELLNAGPLSKEQIDLVSELNLLLTNPDVSKLSDVYKDWQKLKNTFPPNTTVSFNVIKMQKCLQIFVPNLALVLTRNIGSCFFRTSLMIGNKEGMNCCNRP